MSSDDECPDEHAYLQGRVLRARWKCVRCGDVWSSGYRWPWWCLSGHRRFHITGRQMCRSRRDQRAIRRIVAGVPVDSKAKETPK